MRNFILYTFFLFLSLNLCGCHDEPEYDNTLQGNFDALADIIDRHYCFLTEKNIDWPAIVEKYRAEITPEMSAFQLFFVCAQMLDELEDGHVNLTSRFSTSYYRNWWSEYPQDFNLRTLEEYYLEFNWLTAGGMLYKRLPSEVAYIYYPSFANTVSDSALDYALALMANSRGLIIDVRNNGGGALTNIDTFLARFIDKPLVGGYIKHKTGPGHNDFSDPYPMEYKPTENHIKWTGEIVVLTNRSCFSAANSFVMVMKELPNVKIIGARTGGGGGLPFTSELPVGWSVRFSACPMTDAHGNSIEEGIDPSAGYEIHSPDEELAQGKDAILDLAIEILKQNPLTFTDDETEEGEQNN